MCSGDRRIPGAGCLKGITQRVVDTWHPPLVSVCGHECEHTYTYMSYTTHRESKKESEDTFKVIKIFLTVVSCLHGPGSLNSMENVNSIPNIYPYTWLLFLLAAVSHTG